LRYLLHKLHLTLRRLLLKQGEDAATINKDEEADAAADVEATPEILPRETYLAIPTLTVRNVESKVIP
jgi:hypothetical protein